MDLIKVKQLEYSLNYLDKNILGQNNKIVWSYENHSNLENYNEKHSCKV